MQVILLAAGLGIRLGKKTASMPKTLLSVGDKPLCLHILERLDPFQLKQIIVVGGFEYQKLQKVLMPLGDKLRLMKNPQPEKGNLLTLLCAEKEINDSFYIMNADHLYSRTILNRVLSLESSHHITAVCDKDRTLTDDDMKITLKSDGTLKEMKKTLSSYDGGYIGMTYVPKEKSFLYWNAARNLLKKEGEMIHVESVLNDLVASGETVHVCDVSGSSWFEVDTPEDLKKAQKQIKVMD